MSHAKSVTQDEWIAARKDLLAEEKNFTKLRDSLAAKRRDLPWMLVDNDYQFHGSDGPESLADLFADRRQLLIYHFMFGPDWEEGCPSCSFLADHFDGANYHLPQRDISLVVLSRAPLERLQAYKKRMGWRFKWLSSLDSDFNFDYQVSFTAEQMAAENMTYNYRDTTFPSQEAPGISIFIRGDDGQVYHSYSCYARGLDLLIGAYNLMDLTPLGRGENDLPWSMAWVRRHDQY
ncbi:MAG: thioredoxin family protein [Pseudomonadota bacterium]